MANQPNSNNSQMNPEFNPNNQQFQNNNQPQNIQQPNQPQQVQPQGQNVSQNFQQNQNNMNRGVPQNNFQQQSGQPQQPNQPQPWTVNQWYFPNQPKYNQPNNRPTVKPKIQKKWSKISMKGFLIWCSIFILLLLGWAAVLLFSVINNPDQLASMWLDKSTTKSLLQTFAWVFFVLLWFVGFGMMVTNAYRLFSSKNKKKGGYLWALVLWILLLVWAIAWWTNVIQKINTISVEDNIETDKLLLSSVELVWWPQYLYSNPRLKLIAPWSIYYSLNVNMFNSRIMPTLWPATLWWIELDCGNWQTLDLDMPTGKFVGKCTYFNKWNYPLNINIQYTNPQTLEKLNHVVSAGTANFESEIVIKPTKWDIRYSDNWTEMIVGKAPTKVSFDASNIFTDFGLSEYKITWDLNWDGEYDRQNVSSLTNVYKEAKIHKINYRVPWLNDYAYTFPIRVEQSDVPVCEVINTLVNGTQYNISTNFIEQNVGITEYAFQIIDVSQDKAVDTMKNTKWILNYTFPGKWLYSIKVLFVTEEGKNGECESQDIEVGTTDFEVHYDIFYKSPQSPEFKVIGADNKAKLEWSNILLKELPTILRVDLNKIIPDSLSVTKKILLDGQPILSTDSKSFEIKIQEDKTHDLKIVIEDVNRWTKTEKSLKVKIDKEDVIGRIKVTPNTVWTDPFDVRFDASTTVVNDPNDEIVYFSWDFGDGETKENLSQAVVTHIYNYDYDNENGEYNPKLTMKTKRGREIVVELDSPIIVKKPLRGLEILVESHPAQLANIGDRVTFALEIDWLPEKIEWDFGNGNTLECKWRECVQATQVYYDPGTYSVKAKVHYLDQPPIAWDITLKTK